MNPKFRNFLLNFRPAIIAAALKKILRIKRYSLPTNWGIFYIDPVSNFADGLMSDVGYEPDMRATVESILSTGHTFVDLGGNEGFFTVVAAKIVGTGGRVICVEPQARLQDVLRQNITLNDLDNVEIVEKVITAESNGLASFFDSPDTNTGSSGRFRITRYPLRQRMIAQTTLEQLLKDSHVDIVNLLKVDVEGGEYDVIVGSEELFKSGVVEHIALELHPSVLLAQGRDPDSLITLLMDYGYSRNSRFKNMVYSRNELV